MIHFTCPGCKAAHTANSAFAERRAKCVRCGASMYIPREDGEATFAPYGVLDRASGPPSAGPTSSGPASTDSADAEGDEPAPKRKRSNGLLVGAVVFFLLASIGGAAAFYFFGPKPSAPTTKKASPPETKPEPPPPPYELVGPLWAPPPVTIRITAERLAEELARDRPGCNQRYQGRLMEVRGECLSFRSAKLFFRTDGGETAVSTVLPDYIPKFRDPETAQPIAPPPAAPALLGGWFELAALPPTEQPVAGRPVAVLGTYAFDGMIRSAHLTGLLAPADPTHLGKTLAVVGRLSGAYDDDTGLTRVTFMRRNSVEKVQVTGRLNKASSVALRAKNGDIIALSGKCSGRTNYEVRLENCTLIPPDAAQLTAIQLAADYSADVLKYPPIKSDAPVVKVTAAELADAYYDDPEKANARYQHRLLEVTGTVLKLTSVNRQFRFETPTDNPLELQARFDPFEFALFPQDEPVVSVRTEFRGAYRGQKAITLTDCVYRDPDADNPNTRRLTADYLPLQPGRTWEMVRVLYPEPTKPDPKKPAESSKPTKPTPAQAMRLHYQVMTDGAVIDHLLQAGTFAADSLLRPDAPEVKWAGKPLKPDSVLARPVERVWLRHADRFIEIGQLAKSNDPKSQTVEWKSLLRLGAKAGKSWEVEAGPGQLVRTSVEAFFTDDRGREAVRVVSEMTDAKQPDTRTQTTAVYARGVGEVSRVVKVIRKDGEWVRLEQQLIGTPFVPTDLPGTAAVVGGSVAVPIPAAPKGKADTSKK